MFFVFKEIKAKKMRKDALRLALLSMLNKLEGEVLKDFQATVETWDEKPEFAVEKSLKGGPTLLVGTDDEIYKYVNDGTPPHLIPTIVVPGAELRYKSGFKSKTIPGALKSRKGGKFGPFVRKKQVSHPGIVPRDFSGQIRKKYTKRFKRLAEEALSEFAKKSGHYAGKK